MDDRDERSGVKFKDSELIGFPLGVGIGEKSLAKGEIELKLRTGKLEPAPVGSAVQRTQEMLKQLGA